MRTWCLFKIEEILGKLETTYLTLGYHWPCWITRLNGTAELNSGYKVYARKSLQKWDHLRKYFNIWFRGPEWLESRKRIKKSRDAILKLYDFKIISMGMQWTDKSELRKAQHFGMRHCALANRCLRFVTSRNSSLRHANASVCCAPIPRAIADWA